MTDTDLHRLKGMNLPMGKKSLAQADTDRLTAIDRRNSRALAIHYESRTSMKERFDANRASAADVPWLLEQLSLSAARIAQLEAENELLKERAHNAEVWVPRISARGGHYNVGERKEQHG